VSTLLGSKQHDWGPKSMVADGAANVQPIIRTLYGKLMHYQHIEYEAIPVTMAHLCLCKADR